ncbi:hypothetical protein AAW51_5250 [Caldimonas brevitalea]|uniref:Uncharacterized protein n=1 Tax=Caldimonas brevitalea TaxID=413882 RepID=A0A0G3BX48_9BURK|nr:hypothetical protein AAW51_5250 [Caldimonas brevitalea]
MSARGRHAVERKCRAFAIRLSNDRPLIASAAALIDDSSQPAGGSGTQRAL